MTSQEFKDIVNAISAVGFPIVMSILLFWQNYTQTNKYSKNLTDLLVRIDHELLAITQELLKDKQEKEGDTIDDTQDKGL